MNLKQTLLSVFALGVVLLAASGRINWIVGLSFVFAAMMALVFLDSLKRVKVSMVEIELFQKQVKTIADSEIERFHSEIRTAMETQRQALQSANSRTESVEKKLEDTRRAGRLAEQRGPGGGG